MTVNDIFGLESSWDKLKSSAEPVCIYGTGNACERILAEFDRRGIKCAGIFASDGFVRERSFAGFPVMSLAQAEERFGDFTACAAFGSELPDVMQKLRELRDSHGLVMPDLPIAGDEYFSVERLKERIDDAEKVYSALADEHSREVFTSVLAFKQTGDISFLDPVFTDEKHEISTIVKPCSEDIFADLGAYNGDTAMRFLEMSGGCKGICAFEPDKRSLRKLTKNLLSYNDITLVNAAAWDSDGFVRFGQKGGRQSMISASGTLCAARRLDSVLNGRECTVIKYDVEGAERQAIDGSAETIRRFKPRLIVSAYHRPFDMIDLCLQIMELDRSYRFWLRQPPYYPAWDTVIYAV